MEKRLSILINAPVDKVFEYVTRYEVRKYWQKEVFTTLPDQYEKFKSNSGIESYLDIVQTNGSVEAYEIKILTSTTNTFYEYLLWKSNYCLRVQFTFEKQKEPDKVLLILHISITTKGVYHLFLYCYLKKEIKNWHSALATLKNLLEY